MVMSCGCVESNECWRQGVPVAVDRLSRQAMTDTGDSLPNPALRALHRRGVEAAIWGIPAVNYQMMYEASAGVGGPGDNQLVYWPGLLSWKNQTLTPNPDVIYIM